MEDGFVQDDLTYLLFFFLSCPFKMILIILILYLIVTIRFLYISALEYVKTQIIAHKMVLFGKVA